MLQVLNESLNKGKKITGQSLARDVSGGPVTGGQVARQVNFVTRVVLINRPPTASGIKLKIKKKPDKKVPRAACSEPL